MCFGLSCRVIEISRAEGAAGDEGPVKEGCAEDMKKRLIIRRSRGFTLVEFLIALSILSVIAAVSYTSFVSVRRSINVGRENEEALREIRKFLEDLDAEISGALYIRGDEGTLFESRRQDLAGSEVSNLKLTTIKPQTFLELGKRGEVIRVEYEISQKEDGSETLILKKSLYYYTLPPRDYDEPVSFIVGEDFSSFLFRFRSDGQWFDTWESEKRESLPDGVELIFSKGDKKYREFFNVFISEM
jgi:general secretion pathway protein J